MKKLVVTLLEEATVFEGTDTIYRYDLVPSVLREPWALAALVEQSQALCEDDRGQAEVKAEDRYEEAAAEVTRALCAAGLMGTEEPVREDPVIGEKERGKASGTGTHGDPLDALVRAREWPPHRYAEDKGENKWWRNAWRRLTWFHAAMVGVVLAVVGLSWWSLGVDGAVGIAPEVSAEGETPSAVPAVELEAAGTARHGTEGSDSTTRPAVVHEVGSIRVSAPEGFRAELVEGVAILTGPDENLRIRISADPLFSVPPGEILREVSAEVERDATLSDLDPLEPPREERQKMRYREDPGDGSQVRWSTWVESGHHISVGCHTKGTATVVQKASCRIVEESVGLR